MDKMDKYQYEPLPPNGKHVRLVVLHPRDASHPDDIRISIYNTPLEAEHRLLPSFMALSYVWGDANDRRDLAVVGSDEEDLASARRLSVTANLAEALASLPYADNHIILWVDAICINQEDVDERARQVQLMAEIYASAERVLAWTGPATRSSNVALNLLHRIADSLDMDPVSFEMRRKESRWTTESAAAAGYFQLLLDPRFPLPWDGPESQAFEDFLNRPWFERLWVRQEITLGATNAVLLCGSSSIEWAKFRKVAVFLNTKAKDTRHPRLRQWAARTALVADTAVHRVSWLGHLLRQMQRTECADPRDRVYGVLGILPAAAARGLAARIHPDYKKPVMEVYKELVLAEMETTRRIDLLSECHLSGSTSAGWSSWVPDWSIKRERELSITQQCADGQSAVEVRVDGGTLCIKGITTATVRDVVPIVIESVSEDSTTTPPIVALVKELATRLDLSDEAEYQPSRGNSVLEALCYAFSGGHVADHLADEMASPTTPSMTMFKRLIRFALDFNPDDASTHEPSDDVKPDVLLCLASTARACEDRSLLITEEGYIGTGPSLTHAGDRIAVMLGCMRPMVLRRQHDANGDAVNGDTYTIVGPCNAHGLNWGEALLGPLPQGVSFVWGRSGPNGDVGPMFRNVTTGEETVADARVDWDILKVEAEEDGFVQRATVADGSVTMYKRPNGEYFEARGVVLTSLKLV